jgi:hypothetical protein
MKTVNIKEYTFDIKDLSYKVVRFKEEECHTFYDIYVDNEIVVELDAKELHDLLLTLKEILSDET